MGFLDRAKKLAEQAKEIAGDAVEKAKEMRAERQGQSTAPPTWTSATPYESGAFGAPAGGVAAPVTDLRVRWVWLNLPDPAAVLKSGERARFGIPTSTKSDVVQESYGVGRRWNTGSSSIALLWMVDDDHPSDATATGLRWQDLRPAAAVDTPGVGDGAYLADAGGGRRAAFVRCRGVGFVVEGAGLADDIILDLARGAADEVRRVRG
jgi:hypothetical protein